MGEGCDLGWERDDQRQRTSARDVSRKSWLIPGGRAASEVHLQRVWWGPIYVGGLLQPIGISGLLG